MKEEIWNSRKIRFVEKDGEWWAVAKDIATALEFANAKDATKKIPKKYKGEYKVPTLGGIQKMVILSEQGLYRLIMRSNKPQAEGFQDWVYGILKGLREASGLEGFQVFRMLDKDFQKEQMEHVRNSLRNPTKIDYIKANTIANKAVSNKFGFPKMVRKPDMTPDMLVERQAILEDTVQLMSVNEKFGLGLSVSKEVYKQARKEAQIEKSKN